MGIEWKEIKEVFIYSENNVKFKELDKENKKLLKELDIAESSLLGQVLLHISEITINSYLRVLGSGMTKENNIIWFNEKVKELYPGNKLIVATDIWGGIFAISNGDFSGNRRHLWYYAPDLLQWENLEIDYPQFISWICSKNIEHFYFSFMWKNMDSMILGLKYDQAVLVYPFLWSNECDINLADKKIVPIMELISMNADFQKKLIDNG